MNLKKAKKIRKEARNQIGSGIKALSNITRSRPKFIPKSIWVLLYLPLFKYKHLKYFKKHID